MCVKLSKNKFTKCLKKEKLCNFTIQGISISVIVCKHRLFTCFYFFLSKVEIRTQFKQIPQCYLSV